MTDIILMGRGRQVTPVPRIEWEQHLSHVPHHQETRLRFMSAEHHQVRYFVVRELPRIGASIPPEVIADALQLPLAHVHTILDELEQQLFFLVRNAQGAVSWAFPVTVDATPHRLTFSTGEQVFAA
jgi:hypothetical protein